MPWADRARPLTQNTILCHRGTTTAGFTSQCLRESSTQHTKQPRPREMGPLLLRGPLMSHIEDHRQCRRHARSPARPATDV